MIDFTYAELSTLRKRGMKANPNPHTREKWGDRWTVGGIVCDDRRAWASDGVLYVPHYKGGGGALRVIMYKYVWRVKGTVRQDTKRWVRPSSQAVEFIYGGRSYMIGPQGDVMVKVYTPSYMSVAEAVKGRYRYVEE